MTSVSSSPVIHLQPDPSFSTHLPDTVIYTIFHNGLQDHAGHGTIQQILRNLLFIMNISGKADIQDINIMIDQLQFLPERDDIIALFFHIIAEEIRHILYIIIGSVRPSIIAS